MDHSGYLSVYSAAVWAEMKKSTSYTVDIKLNGDHGAVEETQCECAVGQGPSAHCKHVACVLFALTAYHDTGESLTAVTCTEVLQNFHRAKPNKGSPLKASNLAEIRKKQPILFDPRPMKRRNPEKIEEVLRNVVMNWQDKPRLPLLQKYYPANIPALYADHDYMKLTAEDHFLEQHRVSHITHKEAETMEVSTRGQSKNSRWAEERKLRLTSSNFGTLCKITGNRNIKALLNDLVTGRDISSKYLAHGIKYENIAVERFESQSGSGLKTTECGLFVSTTRPWLAASPDRVIDDDTILEVKCPYTARDQVVSERSVPYLSKLDGPSDVPIYLFEDEDWTGVRLGPAGGFPSPGFHANKIPPDSVEWVDRLFRGEIPPSEVPCPQPSSIKLYLCSGTDMELERAVIHDELLPLLKDYCQDSYGLSFQIVDLRLGLDENLLDEPWTRDLFLAELDKCLDTSIKPKMVAVLGMKNGQQILPSHITTSKFLPILTALKKTGSDTTILDNWYQLDTNAVPPRYVLQKSRTIREGKVKWKEQADELLIVLKAGITAAVNTQLLDQEEAETLTNSLVSAEVTKGLWDMENEDGSFAYVRFLSDKMKDLISTEALNYLDKDPVTSEIEKEAFQRMAHICGSLIPDVFSETENVMTSSVSWKTLAASTDDTSRKEYCTRFSQYFYKVSRRLIDKSCQERLEVMPEALVEEVSDHWRWAQEVSDSTQIREDITQIVEAYLIAMDTDQPLVLFGPSGVGKTVMASQIARFTQASAPILFPDMRSIVVIRFCDSYQRGATLTSLLRGLCQQLYRIIGKPQDEIPVRDDDVKLLFVELLTKAEFAGMIIIVIDGLETIYTGNTTLTFDWVPNKLANNVKLIMTARQEEIELLNNLARKTAPENFVMIAPLLPEGCADILKAWLNRESRTLTANQWRILREKLKHIDSPVLLKFLLRQALSWKSYDTLTDNDIPSSVEQAMDFFFSSLESKHGFNLCSKVFGYIACVNGGLSEQELLGCLEQDAELNCLLEIGDSGKTTFPQWKLYSILQDIHNFLTYRRDSGVWIIDWVDRVVRITANERYTKTVAAYHRLSSAIADYFVGEVFKSHTEYSAVIPDIPVLNDTPDTPSTCGRLTKLLPKCLACAERFHLLKSEMLCNFNWIRSVSLIMPIGEVSRLYETCKEKDCQLVFGALKLSNDAVSRDISVLGVELTGRLLPFAAKYKYIEQLIRQCDLTAQRFNPIVANYQTFSVPGAPLRAEIVLPGTPSNTCCFENSDGLLMAFRDTNHKLYHVWDLFTKQQVKDVQFPSGDLFPSTCGRKVCVVEKKRTISVYKTDVPMKLWTLHLQHDIVEFVVSEQYIAYTPAKGTGPVVLYVDSGEVIHRLCHHCGPVTLSSQDEYLLCSSGTQIYLYSLPLMERKFVFQTDERTAKVKFFYTAPMFLAYSTNGVLNLFKFDSVYKSSSCTKLLREFNLLEFTCNISESLILVRCSHCLYVCDTKSAKKIQSIRSFPDGVFLDGTSTFTGAAFSSDSSMIIASRYTYLCIWETSTGKPMRILLSAPCPIDKIFTSSHSKDVASLQANGVMQVWDLSNLGEDVRFSNLATESSVSCVALAFESGKILCCGRDQEEVKLIDTETGEVTNTIQHVEGSEISDIRISCDGQFTITVSHQKDENYDFDYDDDINISAANRQTHNPESSYTPLKEAILWEIKTRRKLYHAVNLKYAFFGTECNIAVFIVCTTHGGDNVATPHTIVTFDLVSETETFNDLPLLVEFSCEPLIIQKNESVSDMVEPYVVSVVKKTKESSFNQRLNETALNWETRVAVTNVYKYTNLPNTVLLKTSDLFRGANAYDQIINVKHLEKEQVLFAYCPSTIQPHTGAKCNQQASLISASLLIYDFKDGLALQHFQNIFPNRIDCEVGRLSSGNKYLLTTAGDVLSLQTGDLVNHILHLEIAQSTFLLDGRYVCGLTKDRRELIITRTNDGVVQSRLFLHGRGSCISVQKDNRTIVIGCENGAVLVFSTTLELSDPAREFIGGLPSRIASIKPGSLLDVDIERISSANPELRRLSARMDRARLTQRQRPPSYKLLSTSVQVVRNYHRQHGSKACCIQ